MNVWTPPNTSLYFPTTGGYEDIRGKVYLTGRILLQQGQVRCPYIVNIVNTARIALVDDYGSPGSR